MKWFHTALTKTWGSAPEGQWMNHYELIGRRNFECETGGYLTERDRLVRHVWVRGGLNLVKESCSLWG